MCSLSGTRGLGTRRLRHISPIRIRSSSRTGLRMEACNGILKAKMPKYLKDGWCLTASSRLAIQAQVPLLSLPPAPTLR